MCVYVKNKVRVHLLVGAQLSA